MILVCDSQEQRSTRACPGCAGRVQSVKAAETVAAASRGFDAGKNVQGRSGTSPSMLPACC